MVGGRGGSAHRIYRCKHTRSAKHACPEPAYIAAELLEDYLKQRLRDAWKGEWDVASAPPSVLADLRAALDEAEAELTAFASDLTARRVLGGEYHAQLELRAKARDDAQQAFQDAAKISVRAERLPSAEALDAADADELRSLYRAVFPLVEIDRGRAPVAERVRVFTHGHDVPVVLPK
jgi:hypothetical protein